MTSHHAMLLGRWLLHGTRIVFMDRRMSTGAMEAGLSCPKIALTWPDLKSFGSIKDFEHAAAMLARDPTPSTYFVETCSVKSSLQHFPPCLLFSISKTSYNGKVCQPTLSNVLTLVSDLYRNWTSYPRGTVGTELPNEVPVKHRASMEVFSQGSDD